MMDVCSHVQENRNIARLSRGARGARDVQGGYHHAL